MEDRGRHEPGFFDVLGGRPPKRLLTVVACFLAAGAATWLVGGEALEPAPRRALFILLSAALLWVTEAMPAYSVGILVIALQIALLGDAEEGIYAQSDRDWEQFVVVLGHPMIWLFFGGFVLAAGLERTRLDRALAVRILGRFGDRPSRVLLGVMSVTFVLSMFMSNTATAAMMIALTAPLLASLPGSDPYTKGLLLGVAVAANVGGMGTLIGTPPNAIAVGGLEEIGIQASFLHWMMVGFPPALFLVLVSWLVILRLHPPQAERLDLSRLGDAPPVAAGEEDPAPRRWQVWVTIVTAASTVGLWLTSSWHGTPTTVVSFVPIVALTTTGILGTEEIRKLPYDVLFLIAGGLALGGMVTNTGLATWIVDHLPLSGLGTIAAAMLMAYTTVVLSNFMSNTAASNILVPIGITLAAGQEAHVAVSIALAASAAMCMPIATPPNSLVFSTGRLATKDFLRIGIPMAVLAPGLLVLWVHWAIDLIIALT